MKLTKNLRTTILILFFSSIAFIYLHNLTRDIYSGDIGDLVTAAYKFGVAHPPGYPLFTILGAIFSHLPLPLPIVSKIGLVSLVSSLVSLVLFYKYSLQATKDLFLSLLSTAILAFSYFFWLHAELPEVFGLNNFFVIALFYTTIRFYLTKRMKYLYAAAVLASLSLTHHQTILFIFPSLALLTLPHLQFVFSKKKHIGYILLYFFIGFLPYLYVPIAALFHPVVNWDNASSLTNFIHLLLRQDYGGFAPSVNNGIPITIKNIIVKDYFRTLFSIFSYILIIVILCGGWLLAKEKRLLFFSLLSAFIISGPFFVFYGSFSITQTSNWGVIERFYIMSTIVLAFFIPYGFLKIKELLETYLPKKEYAQFFLIYFLIVPILLFTSNYPRTNISTTQIGNNLAKDILTSLPKNAVLHATGDTTTFNIWYVFHALRVRPDVQLINSPGVGGNEFLDDEINSYYKEHPHVKLSEIVLLTFQHIKSKRRVFATYELDYRLKNTVALPHGLVYEIIDEKNLPTEKDYLVSVDNTLSHYHTISISELTLAERNLITPEIPLIYSNAFIRVGNFIDSVYKDPQKALPYYQKAITIDPENPAGFAGIALTEYKGNHNCSLAIDTMKKAISMYPIWDTYYRQLYVLYLKCGTQDQQVKNLEILYKQNFHEEIDKRLPANLHNSESSEPTEQSS